MCLINVKIVTEKKKKNDFRFKVDSQNRNSTRRGPSKADFYATLIHERAIP